MKIDQIDSICFVSHGFHDVYDTCGEIDEPDSHQMR